MNIGDIKAAVGVIRCLREDWNRAAVEGQITTLAGIEKYSHADVLWVAITIASDFNNRSPVTLTMKAEERLTELHSKTAANRTPGPRESDKGFLCDVCTKPERDCQTDATNLDGIDHAYISARQAKHARDQMPAGGRIAAARARAAIDRDVSKISAGFKLPADVTDQKPQPQIQEEEAS